jgi:5-methylthioadenosine/S-adenosylhomocysteine deaminase
VARAYVQEFLEFSDRVYPSLFCHSPYTCSADTLRQAKAIADEFGVLFQIHVAETKTEVDQCLAAHSMTPVKYLDRLGVLDEGTLLVHAVWVNDEDIDCIARRCASISHNPESNMKLGAGIAPVGRLLAAGVTVGLGTDGCASNNNLDLFQEMDTTAKLHKVVSGDPTALDAQSVIRMATIDGASAIGLGDRVGSLEVGKQADLITINTHRPHLTPIYRAESHIVYAAGAADVETVVVGGRVIVRNRTLLTMDVTEIMSAARRLGAQVRGEPL